MSDIDEESNSQSEVFTSESSPASSQDSSGVEESVSASSQAQECEESEPEPEAEPSDAEDLAAKEAEDENLWPDEHSSDDEPFDPEKPEDLETANAKELAEDDPSLGEASHSSGDSDEDDSAVVADNEEELECSHHNSCVVMAEQVDSFILGSMSGKGKLKHRRAALAEAICDHYKPQ